MYVSNFMGGVELFIDKPLHVLSLFEMVESGRIILTDRLLFIV